MSCVQYILEINSKLGHQHTRWSGESCFVAVLARFKKWKTWLTSPNFPALSKIFTGCYFNGTIVHLFYKKSVVTYPIKAVHQARKLGTRKLTKGIIPILSPLIFVLFCLFLFQFFL